VTPCGGKVEGGKVVARVRARSSPQPSARRPARGLCRGAAAALATTLGAPRRYGRLLIGKFRANNATSSHQGEVEPSAVKLERLWPAASGIPAKADAGHRQRPQHSVLKGCRRGCGFRFPCSERLRIPR